MKKQKVKRVLTAPSQSSNNFAAYKPLLLELYPNLKQFLKQMDAQIGSGRCKSCVRKRWLNNLKMEIKRRPGAPAEKLAELEPLLGAAFIHSLSKRAATEPVTAELPVRTACADCCRKHIAQAIILMNESFMGYPEHADMALAHLREAAEEIVAQDEAMAEAILAEHNKVDSNRDYYPELTPLLKKAIMLVDASA